MVDLPEGYTLVKELPDTCEVLFGSLTRQTLLIIPKKYLPRMKRDPDFGRELRARYAKYINWTVAGRTEKSGVVPDDVPFAVTQYENVPGDFFKLFENDQEIHLSMGPPDVRDKRELLLIVPSHMWLRFTEDHKWRHYMVLKHAVPVEDGYEEYYRARREGCVISEENFQLADEK